ncbi:MAG: tRNA lysidine(34) synthetase TilS [Anaerolineae bacterium]|nr:tRNA lysidine(34) synthetase TilS [Anaerolineae bacterium]
MDLVRDVAAYIERHHLLESDAALVVGVSGGPDSVTLLHLLRRLAPAQRITLHVAHLNHGIRGKEADGDEAFVVDLASRWDLAVTTERVDIPELARRQKLALEETARRARYAFLCRVAQQCGARQVAVAHNADDQAETVLMHLLRGSGPAGLRGMLPSTLMRDYRLLPHCAHPPADLRLIRPLLSTSRADIEAYCREHALPTRFDRSNLDTTYYRNKLRHEVLPYLREINPQISERLRNLAEVVRADYNLLKEFVSVARDTLLVSTLPDALVFDLARWREQPLAIQRAIVRQSAYKLRRTLRDVDFQHVEHAVQIAQTGQTGAQAVLPHQLALTVGYTTLTIGDADALHLPAERPWLPPDAEIPIAVPGVTPLPNGWQLHAQEMAHWNMETIRRNPNPLVAWLDRDAVGKAPALRTREEGDRFRPQGMDGAEVRLSDFLINIKLPRRWRDHLPLLVADDHILWVTGLRLSQKARVREDSERVAYLRLCGP